MLITMAAIKQKDKLCSDSVLLVRMRNGTVTAENKIVFPREIKLEVQYCCGVNMKRTTQAHVLKFWFPNWWCYFVILWKIYEE